jgi:hypothetical protein
MIRILPRVLAGTACLSLVSLVSSCGGKDTHEAIMEDSFALMEQVANTLEGVQGGTTAARAASELVAIADQFEEIAERNEAIGPPSPQTVENLEEKFKARRARLASRLNKAKLEEVVGDPDSPLHDAIIRLSDVVGEMR